MIRWSLHCGNIRGVPILIHWTFIVFFGILVWLTGITHGGGAAVENLELVGGVLFSIVLHEIGHAVTAQHRGLGVREICLYPFGGVTVYATSVPPGADEMLVALAGPAANGLLAAILLLAHGFKVPLPAAPGEPGFSVFASLFWANAFLTLLNLVPALPLDGGCVLRSLLTPRMGYLRASRLAGNLGQALGLALLIPGALINIWLGFAGLIIFLGAAAEVQQLQPLLILHRQTVSDLMDPDLVEATPEAPFTTLHKLVNASPLPNILVVSGDQVLGFIPAAKILALAQAHTDELVHAKDLIVALSNPIPASTPLPAARDMLRKSGAEYAPVSGKNGTIVGILSLKAIERAQALLEALRHQRLSQ